VKPGVILDVDGQRIGEHQGLAFYTIGQRKGLGVASTDPLYVIEKDTRQNALIVGHKDDLGRIELIAAQMQWVSGIAPNAPFRAQVKIRYKAQDAWAWVTPIENQHVRITFDQPLRDITPGQAAVLYDGEVCLGGGIIQPSRGINS
jgi:tRNA-specific 2-thiouridylase